MADAVRERKSEGESRAAEPEWEESALKCEEGASGALRFSPLEEGREPGWDSSSDGDSPVGAADDWREGGADSVAWLREKFQ